MDRPPTTTKPLLSVRRRRGAAIQIIGGGVLLLVAPGVLGNTQVAEGFATLAPVGWFMVVGGALLLWSLRDKAPSTKRLHVAPSPGVQRTAPLVDAPPLVPRTSVDIDLDLPSDPAGLHGADTSPACRTRVARPHIWDVAFVEGMERRRFESVVETLFQQAGFETGLQSHGGQDGADIWLYSRSQTGGPVSLVQCRHGQGERVHAERLRALRAAMDARQVPRGQFATTATFTPEAVAFARQNGIHLLDANGLLALIDKRTPEQQAALMALALG